MSEQVTVIVELNGDPVAVTGGSAADLANQQAPAKNAINGTGATVLDAYQHALNGFAVRTSRANVAAIARVAGVKAVKQTHLYQQETAKSVPFIGANQVWDGGEGFHGEGIKIGIIDTGLDYTHANFGGPGTAAAYTAAHAAEKAPADPTLFGPSSTTKIKGGFDFVGDDYDASSADPAINTPKPDPNPLDCNGHGSHVGGIAAGFGVTDSGATFRGPYTTDTPKLNFRIGPGVAPLAELYAIRVFGCEGSASSEVIIAGIDWAVEHHLDVINMSLGSPFGSGDHDDAEIDAADNASLAGTMVVASAGNSGPGAYIVGRPSTASRAISVAAMDTNQTFQGALMNLSTGQSVLALNANGAALPSGSIPIMVLRTSTGAVSLGCNDTDYPASVAGKAVVTVRGVCPRVDRAILAQRHGAAAAVMLNTDAGYPPFEGPITGVTIPFLGVKGTLATAGSDAQKVVAADGGSTTLSPQAINNPGFRRVASFTSGGPRFDDSSLKPEVAAPGVSIVSTGVGTGNGAAVISGTSQAAPHVTGLAALVQQSHPSWWSVEDQKQAIINTALGSDVAGFTPRLAGGGLVNAPGAAKTVAVAFGNSDKSTLSFGFDWDMRGNMRDTGLLLIRNHGAQDITFNLSQEFAQGAPHSISFERGSVRVPAFGHASLNVTLTIPVRTAGTADSNDPNNLAAPITDVSGIVTLTPTNGGNSGIALHVPYYVVPRALSNVKVSMSNQLSPSQTTSQVRLTNAGSDIAGTGDFYTLGQIDNSRPASANGQPFELRSAGVQSFNGGSLGQILVFALNSRGRWTNVAPYEFDVLVTVPDGTKTGKQFQIFAFDFGAVTTGSANGQVGSFVLNRQTGQIAVDFFATAPLNGNTLELPVRASRLGLTAANPRFDFNAFSFDAFTPAFSVLPDTGHFNAFTPAITFSNGGFVVVPPGDNATVTATLNVTEAARTPAKGIMIVSLDNTTEGDAQADTETATMPAPAAAAATASVQSQSSPQGVGEVVKNTPKLSPDR